MTDETKGAATGGFDILNVFSQQTTSSELGAGVHERVRLISIDPEPRKDGNGNLVKKQLFLKFKKFSKEDSDVGEKEISFFLIDPSKDSAMNNLHTFISQVRELLSLYYTNAEIEEKFDPLAVLVDKEDGREDSEIEADYLYDVIKKKVMKKEKDFTNVEKAICSQFNTLMAEKIGFDSAPFRLKLEESQDAKYIQIPRFDRFVEKSTVEKTESVLYTNLK
jgi:hypothetical protein